MAKRTNKTDHVLNLLATGMKNQPASSEEESKDRAPEEESRASGSEETDAAPPVTVVQDKEDDISERVKSMLEEELAQEVKKAPAPEEAGKGERKPEFVTVNVMETLVRKHAEVYMRKFGVCLCERCRADVVALSLTEKPGKYVVVDTNAAAPLMNYFETRLKGEMTARLAKACMVVGENPRH